jgi:hypothetical protein
MIVKEEKLEIWNMKKTDVGHKHHEERKGVEQDRAEQSDLHQAESDSGEPAPPGPKPDLNFEESTNTHLKRSYLQRPLTKVEGALGLRQLQRVQTTD